MVVLSLQWVRQKKPGSLWGWLSGVEVESDPKPCTYLFVRLDMLFRDERSYHIELMTYPRFILVSSVELVSLNGIG